MTAPVLENHLALPHLVVRTAAPLSDTLPAEQQFASAFAACLHWDERTQQVGCDPRRCPTTVARNVAGMIRSVARPEKSYWSKIVSWTADELAVLYLCAHTLVGQGHLVTERLPFPPGFCGKKKAIVEEVRATTTERIKKARQRSPRLGLAAAHVVPTAALDGTSAGAAMDTADDASSVATSSTASTPVSPWLYAHPSATPGAATNTIDDSGMEDLQLGEPASPACASHPAPRPSGAVTVAHFMDDAAQAPRQRQLELLSNSL